MTPDPDLSPAENDLFGLLHNNPLEPYLIKSWFQLHPSPNINPQSVESVLRGCKRFKFDRGAWETVPVAVETKVKQKELW